MGLSVPATCFFFLHWHWMHKCSSRGSAAEGEPGSAAWKKSWKSILPIFEHNVGHKVQKFCMVCYITGVYKSFCKDFRTSKNWNWKWSPHQHHHHRQQQLWQSHGLGFAAGKKRGEIFLCKRTQENIIMFWSNNLKLFFNIVPPHPLAASRRLKKMLRSFSLGKNRP